MIEELQIRDLGVIADAALPLGSGFTAITGETGAGKTMVVTALGLLMGERSDAGAVRSGTDRARVTGIVRTQDGAVTELVEDAGGEVVDGELVMSRIVSAEGRSRASVGGTAAPASVLANLSGHLFVVHGQSDQLRLKSQVAQRETLDRFAGGKLAKTLNEYRHAYAKRSELENELATISEARRERLREAERLRVELDEITAVEPLESEDEQLKQRIERLGNIEELRGAALAAHTLLSAQSDDVLLTDASALLAEAMRELERAASQDDELQGLYEATASIAVQIQETASDLATYTSNLDAEGPEELALASDRLAAITSLTRKYGSNVTEVLAYAERGHARLSELDGDDHRISQLEAELVKLQDTQMRLSEELSKFRHAAATLLGERVTSELQQLALPDAEFSVAVTPVEPSSHGADSVEMLLSPHPGSNPRPVAKGASGGELSRVMLALEVVVAGTDPVPTFVFDEVDAGVGGSAAIEIGRRLAQLAQTSQVIVVTHLAQVAAFADNHLLVVKDSAGGYTESSCRQLMGEERQAEMARLLSGMSDSASALEHATELLALKTQK